MVAERAMQLVGAAKHTTHLGSNYNEPYPTDFPSVDEHLKELTSRRGPFAKAMANAVSDTNPADIFALTPRTPDLGLLILKARNAYTRMLVWLCE